MEKQIVVSKLVSSKIKTPKDLNDFYAFMESNLEPEVEVSYLFAEDEQDKIDELMDDLDYIVGVYDLDNIKRILG